MGSLDGAEKKKELRKHHYPGEDEEETSDDDDEWSAWCARCSEVRCVASGGGERCPWCTGSHYDAKEGDRPVYWTA